MKTFFMRIHCRFVSVTRSIAYWQGLPHVALGVGCSVAASFTPWSLPQFPAEQAPAADIRLYVPEAVGARGPVDVPEPGALGLLVVGVLVVWRVRR